MKNIMGWAVTSVAALLVGACTTTVNEDNPDGGTTSGSGGSGSTTSSTSSSSTTTTTTTGSGGAGGSGSDGGSCTISASPTACETCAFAKCSTELCACNAVVECKGGVADYFTCLAGLDGGDMEGCATALNDAVGNDNLGKANVLATCMDQCQEACQGKDGG